ncbi:MAG: GNAT family N-acetyltransferase [Dehalococcoidales bacterium]|nr:GNAT family N-acetyltransferase [Dehalococcoidales bacterium]
MIDFSLIKTIPADKSHYEFIYRLKKEVYYDYITRIWSWNEDEQRQFYAQEWQKLRPDIILYNNKPIGSICVWNDKEAIYIERFYILPAYQNKGIGSHLVKTILDRADKEGLIARLHVLKINPAISLYKRHGYVITDEDEIMYRMERKPAVDRPKRKYKAVIFDLYGTLVDIFTHGEYYNVMETMISILKAPHDEFLKLWFGTAERRAIGVFRTLEENLRYICRELNISVTEKQMAEASRIRHDYVAKSLTPREGTIEVLAYLKSGGYKVGLVSNCSTEPPAIWPDTPFATIFDVTVFSSAAGVQKPDPRIYRMATDALGVKPEDCLYVGDGDSNELTGAAGVGMHPVLIKVPPEGNDVAMRTSKKVDDFPCPCISSLKEVLNLVK